MFLPNVIKINPYNFELYRFKVGASFWDTLYRVQQNKVALKVFRSFLSNRLEFYGEVLQIYLLKCSTSKCEVKCDSVEKWWSYRLYHMTVAKASLTVNLFCRWLWLRLTANCGRTLERPLRRRRWLRTGTLAARGRSTSIVLNYCCGTQSSSLWSPVRRPANTRSTSLGAVPWSAGARPPPSRPPMSTLRSVLHRCSSANVLYRQSAVETTSRPLDLSSSCDLIVSK